MTTFDEVLEEVGRFGRAQRRTFGLLCLLSLPFTFVYAGIVFQGFTPPHRCRDAAAVRRGAACGWSVEERHRVMLPQVDASGTGTGTGTGTEPRPSSCSRYQVDWNRTGLTCELDRFNLSGAPLTGCQDGWEYEYEGRRSFVTEFDLVCADSWLVDMYQSAMNVGFLVSSFLFGYLANRFGRRVCILAANIMSVLSALVLAVAPDYVTILVFRALLGLSIKGGWITAYVLLTEMVGVSERRTVGIVYQMFSSVGSLILPLLAYVIPDWRWLHAATSAPYLLFISYYWFIPESPRWLLSQNKTSEALRIIESMAEQNQRKFTKTLEIETDEKAGSPSGSVMDLVRTPNMRKHTLIFMFNWFTSAVVYQGLIMRIGITGGNIYLDFLISGLVEFPATFLILFTIERIGRRLPFAAANLVAGAACIITAFIPDSVYWLKVGVACVGRLGTVMAFELVVFVNTELYPTYIRNLGVFVCSTLCDVGGILAPFLLYRLASVWLELPLIVFGVVALVAGGLVLLLPETKGARLPETLEDIESPAH